MMRSHLNRNGLSRRQWMSSLAIGFGGVGASGWFSDFARAAVADPARRRSCILLWMSGGPSQMDTFDLKPGHPNGGSFKEIQTNTPGMRFSEHLPRLAGLSENLALLRGMSTGEGDHGRGTYLMRTGHKPMGVTKHPSVGASLANQLGGGDSTLPPNVSIGSFRSFAPEAFSPGFLGAKYGPLMVGSVDGPSMAAAGQDGFADLRVQSLQPDASIDAVRQDRRMQLWQGMQRDFVADRHVGAAHTQHQVYTDAMRLMTTADAEAFDLSKEPEDLRRRYGTGVFGQGCLMARRLVQRGVPFVEVSLGTNAGGIGWDTHSDIFRSVETLSTDLDNGWATLMEDLRDHGLLETTTILWMGEFGRTPRINPSGGRDHFPQAWTTALAGGGIAGGSVHGKTSEDGMQVVDGQVTAQDLLATLCEAIGIGAAASNMEPSGRPIPIAEGTAVAEVLA